MIILSSRGAEPSRLRGLRPSTRARRSMSRCSPASPPEEQRPPGIAERHSRPARATAARRGKNLPSESPPLPGTHNFARRRSSAIPAHLPSGTEVCPAFGSPRQCAGADPIPAHSHINRPFWPGNRAGWGTAARATQAWFARSTARWRVWIEICAGPGPPLGQASRRGIRAMQP